MDHKEYMKSLCYQHMNKPVVLHTADNQQIQGIIENVDDDYVHMLVPTDMPMSESMMMSQGQMMNPTMSPPMMWEQGQMMNPTMMWDQGQMMSPPMTLAPMANRQWFGYPGFYPYWGPGPFRRFLFPLAALTAISLLPFF